jgi:hypothetical protein
MLCTDHRAPRCAPTASAQLSLTWTFTETYTHRVPLDAVASATGQGAQALAADPSSLLGVVGDRLADLLTDHQDEDRVVGPPEVEIITADYTDSPTIAELAEAGRQALQAESDADQYSDAGRALAALLAGLRREGITDR